MKALRLVAKICLPLCFGLFSVSALAGPPRCSAGNQDSTCIAPLTTTWQTPPSSCPGGAGWTIAVPAQWIGSKYSAPQCNYQPPPTCPNGFNQTAAPSWNGSSWVGLGCAAPPPALPTTAQLASVCESAIAAEMARAGFNGTNGTYRGVWGALQGPYALGGGQVYPAGMFAGMGGSMRGGQGPGDFYYARDLGNPSAGGATGGNGIGVCWFQSGTANLTGYDYLEDLSSDGG